jgi:membrane-associated phospholipid phosphatase
MALNPTPSKPNFFVPVFYQLFSNIRKFFTGWNLVWQIIAIALTYLLVVSGFDWAYFKFFSHTLIYYALFPAAFIGFLVPVFLPVWLLISGRKKSDLKILNAAYGLIQAAALGLLLSDFYKAFTGRNYPPLRLQSPVDSSRIFNFGFWRSGVFWGWPSSHTTVAFAICFATLMLFPKNKIIKFWAIFYAAYVGLGVSMSIHWFSDFVAGAIMGSIVGVTVGQSFKRREAQLLETKQLE